MMPAKSKSNASAIDMTIGYESQTAVSAASQDANGSYTMSSLSEGYYEVTMDKDFDLYTLTDTGVSGLVARGTCLDGLRCTRSVLDWFGWGGERGGDYCGGRK